MDYYIIAGEASGDLHGSNLIKELRKLDPKANFRCWGGQHMEQAGAKLVKHYGDLAFMGFWEVIKNLSTIIKNIRFCKKDIKNFNPDVVILIDYPGFNLRIAKFAKSAGFRVMYYISPQVWAWNSSRVNSIQSSVDNMYVILPFEPEFYDKWNYSVDFVGHPLLDAIEQRSPNTTFRTDNGLDPRPIVAILPGSRKQEIAKMLPTMLRVKRYFNEHQFVVGLLENIDQNFISEYHKSGVTFVYGRTYELLENAYAALVTSGTATLETSLFNVPQVVCYKGNVFSYMIGKLLVDVKFIAMVNLILGRRLVEELIQGQFTVDNLKSALSELIENTEKRELQLAGYQELRSKLGGPGASKKTAKLILQNLQNR